MKTNATNRTAIKPPEAMTDGDIFKAIAKLTGGYRGRQATYEINVRQVCHVLVAHHPEGWTDGAGKWHEQVPDFLHSVDALLPVIRLLSFDSQVALQRRVHLCTPPRFICLEILREFGHFDP